MNTPAFKSPWNNGEGDAGRSAAAAMPLVLSQSTVAPSSKLSFIEDHEVDEAKRVVEQAWLAASKGKPLNFRVAGYKLLVKIYIRPEELKTITNPTTGEQTTLYLPDMARAEDKFNSCAGLVLQVGDMAYTGNRPDGTPRYPNGPWTRVGDWCCFSRYGGKRVTINGVACMILNDDAIDGVLTDPADIETGHAEYRI